jgi:hypothetical protein
VKTTKDELVTVNIDEVQQVPEKGEDVPERGENISEEGEHVPDKRESIPMTTDLPEKGEEASVTTEIRHDTPGGNWEPYNPK